MNSTSKVWISALSLALSACGGGSGANAPMQAPLQSVGGASAPAGPVAAASAPVASAPASSVPVAAVPATVQQFGADLDGNGVPDRLDAFLRELRLPPTTQVAAEADLRLTAILSDKVTRGAPLTAVEKQRAFASKFCLRLTAKSEGAHPLPSMDDAFQQDRASFRALRALEEALNGTVSWSTGNMAEMCEAAR